jgi:hypothetical protein
MMCFHFPTNWKLLTQNVMPSGVSGDSHVLVIGMLSNAHISLHRGKAEGDVPEQGARRSQVQAE